MNTKDAFSDFDFANGPVCWNKDEDASGIESGYYGEVGDPHRSIQYQIIPDGGKYSIRIFDDDWSELYDSSEDSIYYDSPRDAHDAIDAYFENNYKPKHGASRKGEDMYDEYEPYLYDDIEPSEIGSRRHRAGRTFKTAKRKFTSKERLALINEEKGDDEDLLTFL